MTKVQVSDTIRTGILQLNRWEYFNHYFPAIAMYFVSACFPAIWLYDQVIGFEKPLVIRPGDFIFEGFVLMPFVLGCVILFYRRRELFLIPILAENGNQKVTLVALAKSLGWSVVTNRKAVLIAVTNPPFWSGSWGERITIVFDDGVVLVNSICDPQKQSSLVSCGRNNSNVRAVSKRLTRPNKRVIVA